MLVFVLFSCDAKEDQPQRLKPPITNETPTENLDFKCEANPNVTPTSSLKQLATKLSTLENNYQIQSIKKGDPTKSILISSLKRSSIKPFRSREKVYKITNFEAFAKSITAINFCHVKGTKDLSKNLYARAKIEEIIFNSTDCAQTAFESIQEIRKDNNAREAIDKSPSSMFKIDRKIYYISSGGFYMMDFYQEIAEHMKR